jgi:hypothetical protein
MPMQKQKRVASTSNINLPVAMGGLATPPTLPSQFHPYGHDISGIYYDAGSRSTSAYSTVTDSAAPLLKKDTYVPAYPATYPTPHGDAVRKSQNQPFNIRLPSDQLDMIIKAIQVPHQTQHIGDPSTTMPPPPLPQHAAAPKDNVQPEQHTTSFGLTFPPFGETGITTTNVNRRDDSRFSDISMHPTCTSFPACTTEDSEGRIIHSSNCNAGNNDPGAPSTVVRGRKEGSSPTKRKSSRSSSTQAAQEDNPKAKKRTRRSSRLLQHDSGYDGCDESSSASNGDAVAGASDDRGGDGAASRPADVEQPGGSTGE